MNKEPAVIINGLAELVRQILPLMVVVGLIQLSPEKLAGLVSIIGLVLAFVSTTLLRTQVVSTDKANQQIEVAIASPANTTVEKVIQKTEAQNN